MSIMDFCSRCGNRFTDAARFCAHCGAPRDTAPAVRAARSRVALIAGSVVAAVLVLAAVVWFALPSSRARSLADAALGSWSCQHQGDAARYPGPSGTPLDSGVYGTWDFTLEIGEGTWSSRQGTGSVISGTWSISGGTLTVVVSAPQSPSPDGNPYVYTASGVPEKLPDAFNGTIDSYYLPEPTAVQLHTSNGGNHVELSQDTTYYGHEVWSCDRAT